MKHSNNIFLRINKCPLCRSSKKKNLKEHIVINTQN